MTVGAETEYNGTTDWIGLSLSTWVSFQPRWGSEAGTVMVSPLRSSSKTNDPCPGKTAKPYRANKGYPTMALGPMSAMYRVASGHQARTYFPLCDTGGKRAQCIQ